MQPRKLAQGLQQLEDHLQWLKEEGVRTVVADAQLLIADTARPPAAKPPPSATLPARGPGAAAAVAPAAARPPAPPACPVAAVVAAPAAGADPAAVAAAQAKLAEIARRVAACQQCALGRTRTNTVPGQGHPQPDILFIGEGPGEDEDRQGLAFVGAAGKLLTRMIIRMGLTREQVFIANIVKCRPPNNRTPLPDEAAACLPYLREQIGILKPKVIVCLGASAVKGLLNNQLGITKLRGHWLRYEGVDVMPTYHPSYLLRGGGEDKARWWEVWEDLVAVLKKIGREPPPQKTAAG